MKEWIFLFTFLVICIWLFVSLPRNLCTMWERVENTNTKKWHPFCSRSVKWQEPTYYDFTCTFLLKLLIRKMRLAIVWRSYFALMSAVLHKMNSQIFKIIISSMTPTHSWYMIFILKSYLMWMYDVIFSEIPSWEDRYAYEVPNGVILNFIDELTIFLYFWIAKFSWSNCSFKTLIKWRICMQVDWLDCIHYSISPLDCLI